MKKFLAQDDDREPRLYILAIVGEADAVLSSWYQTESDAPRSVEVATHEWPGHGVRDGEPLSASLEALGDDAFETFREAMSVGHFIMCGDSVGVLVMTYVCERAQRELGVSPQSVFAIDRGPPHLPVFSEYGHQLLASEPERWLSLWNPTIHRLCREGKVAATALDKWAADMRLENDTRPVGWYRFPCRVNAVVALGSSTDFPPPGRTEDWVQERRRCTRSGKGYSFEPREYDLWKEWADDVWVYEIAAEHETVQRSEAFLSLLWCEAARILGE